MANAKQTNDTGKLVAEWAKAQKVYEDAVRKADEARAEVQGYCRDIYKALGTEPFYVASLKRKYRAIHKPERKSKSSNGAEPKVIAESWVIIPLPENETNLSF